MLMKPSNFEYTLTQYDHSDFAKSSFKYSLGIKARDSKSIVQALSLDEIRNMPQENFKPDSLKTKIVDNKLDKNKNRDIIIYNKSSGILRDPLRKDELLESTEKEKRKTIREQFKRFLQVERIHFQFPKREKGEKGKSAIRLEWKFFNPRTNPRINIFKFLKTENKRSLAFPSINQKILLDKLDKFPVFSVENNLRQIILSYPAEAFIKNFSDKLYDYYYRIFEWEKDTRATNIGFFFFNPEDAKLYEHNIHRFGPLSAADLGTRIVPFRLSTAYQLNRTSPPETRFLFIPDIKEVGDLLTIHRYKYRKKMQFHTNQKITKNGFANQPLYSIEDTQIKKSFFAHKSISYQGPLSNYKYFFLSLEGAEAAWNTFRKLNLSLKLPAKPNLLVYNFGSFIKDCEQNPNLKNQNFVLVSNRETYQLLEKSKEIQQQKSKMQKFYENKIYPFLFFMKLWANRFRLVLFHAPRINEYPRRDLIVPKSIEKE
uniref:hypothetical protein n=1 Tax=Rhodospora sordida TaxID=362230 RepID=UPI001FCD6BC1|nr:hypothetical protein MW557_pgp191 [Rhodospora sordida]UNJ14903.1 hypothetical protein [Rhodospora sordida]